MSTIECKACGLINPPSAITCDCGHHLGDKVVVKTMPPTMADIVGPVLGIVGLAFMLAGIILFAILWSFI